jgi:hypothetical protein
MVAMYVRLFEQPAQHMLCSCLHIACYNMHASLQAALFVIDVNALLMADAAGRQPV